MRVEQRSDGTLVRIPDPIEVDLYEKLHGLKNELHTTAQSLSADVRALREEIASKPADAAGSLKALGSFFTWEEMLHDTGRRVTDSETNRVVWESNDAGILAYLPGIPLSPGTWTFSCFVRGPVRITIDSATGVIKQFEDRQDQWRTVEFHYEILQGEVALKIEALGAAALDYAAFRLGVGMAGGGTQTGTYLLLRTVVLSDSTTQLHVPEGTDEGATMVTLNGLLQKAGEDGDYTVEGTTLTYSDPQAATSVTNIVQPHAGALPLVHEQFVNDTTRYTLQLPPQAAASGSEIIIVNGLLATPGSDYDYLVRDGFAVFAAPINAGERIDIFYPQDGAVRVRRTLYSTDGTTVRYTLPVDVGDGDGEGLTEAALIYLNGLLLYPGAEGDYQLDGDAVVLNEAPAKDSLLTILTFPIAE